MVIKCNCTKCGGLGEVHAVISSEIAIRKLCTHSGYLTCSICSENTISSLEIEKKELLRSYHKLRNKLDKAEEMLRKYGCHLGDCPSAFTHGQLECNCGWDRFE